jgi:hypothetical protein
MRKGLWIGSLAVTLACGGIYCYFNEKPSEVISLQGSLGNTNCLVNAKGDGDAETSEDGIEPLIVERGNPGGVQSQEPPIDEGPMPRVVLAPGMQQPPRPDAETGLVRRMPYADEEEILGLARPPLERILDGNPVPLKIFEELEKANWAEESENQESKAPAMPYHHYPMHCPRNEGCPAPYPYRTMPRD